MNRPNCAVKGMIRAGHMCGSIIVSDKSCGFSGNCEHKENVDPVDTLPQCVEKTEKTKNDCGGAQHYQRAGSFHHD